MTKTSADAIVAAARALFREQGYAGTSMKDLADRVGLQKGSLYNYVSSKEELVPRVLDLTLAEVFPDGADQADWLSAYTGALERLVSHLTEHRRCIGMHLAYGVGAEAPQAVEAVQRFFATCRDRLAGILAKAVPPSIASVMAADALSRLEGSTVWLVIADDDAPMRRAVEALTREANAVAAGRPAEAELLERLADAEARSAALEAALRGEIEAASCFL